MNDAVGFVILNYCSWECTKKCVNSIFDTFKPAKKIIIVDNCSPDGSFEALKKEFNSEKYTDISVIKTEKNGGFSYGNNYGFKYISENFPEINKIIFTNNDIVFKEKCISELAANLKDNAIITAPKIFSADGVTTTGFPWKRKQSVMEFFGLVAGREKDHFQWHEIAVPTDVYMVNGCCFMVNKNYFENIKCFDENVFLYNEENILSARISATNYKITAVPDAEVIHEQGVSTGRRNIFIDKEYLKSAMYYLRTYRNFNKFELSFYWFFMVCRTGLKLILRKISAPQKGYFNYILETFLTLKANYRHL